MAAASFTDPRLHPRRQRDLLPPDAVRRLCGDGRDHGMPPAPLWLRQVADRVGGVKKPARFGAVPGPGAARHERAASAEQAQRAQRTVEPGELASRISRCDSAASWRSMICRCAGSDRADHRPDRAQRRRARRPRSTHARGSSVRRLASVRLDGRDITRTSISRRARMGLGRTFQQMELFDALSVAENVAIGCEAVARRSQPNAAADGRRQSAEPSRGPWRRAGTRAAWMDSLSSARAHCQPVNGASSNWLDAWPEHTASCCWTSRHRAGSPRVGAVRRILEESSPSETWASCWSSTTCRW